MSSTVFLEIDYSSKGITQKKAATLEGQRLKASAAY